MIKVEGSLRACTCVSTWINWIAFSKKPCFYHRARRRALTDGVLDFRNIYYFFLLVYGSVMFCVPLLWLYVCVHLGGNRNMIRLRNERALRRPKALHNSNFLSSSRYTSLRLSWNALFCFPPSNFLFFYIPFPLPLWASLHSLVIIHLKLMSVHFCKRRTRFSERKSYFSVSMHTAIGMKALWWMLRSSTALYFPIHASKWSVRVLRL